VDYNFRANNIKLKCSNYAYLGETTVPSRHPIK
jgi:hypothetical protein